MLPSFSVKRPLTIIVAVIFVLILGGTSASRMTTTLIPELNLPYALVITAQPGASPDEVEATITAPIEQALATTSGINNITSTSSANASMVFLEFVEDTNMDAVMLEMRESLDLLRDYLPDTANTPRIVRISADSLPVAVLTVDMEGDNRLQLSRFVEDKIAPSLESVDGVASVTTTGLARSQVNVELRQDKLDEVNSEVAELMAYAGMEPTEAVLTRPMIMQVLMAQNFSFPSGSIEEDGESVLVRVGDKYGSIDELEQTLIFELEEAEIEVRLKDIASITVTDNTADNYTRVNGNEAIILTLQKQSEFSTTDVANAIHARIGELEGANSGLRITALMDQGEYIDMIVGAVTENLLWGAILAVLVLFLFLRSIKLTGVIALSIPFSLVVALLLMYFSGITLNMLSLSGLALGVGMLVDNSIVVIENIYLLRSRGVPVKEAAIDGAKKVSMAIAASTFTTCAVFIPFAFSTGFVRQLFVDLALTVCFSILASLIVALTFVPMMCSGALRNTQEKRHRIMDKAQDVYEKVLRASLNHKVITLGGAAVLVGAAVFVALNMGTQFFPTSNSNQITTTLTLPTEATFEEKIEAVEKIVAYIEDKDGVSATGASLTRNGGSMTLMGNMGSTGGGGDTTTVYTLLKDGHATSSQVISKQIDDWASDAGLETSSTGSAMNMSMLTGEGVQVVIEGPELDMLRTLSDQVIAKAEAIEGTTDVSASYGDPTSEYRIRVDKDKAISHGLTVAQVLQAVAVLTQSNQSVTTVTEETIDYPVYVTVDSDEATTIADIKALELTSSLTGDKVSLASIATVELAKGFESIDRSNQTRTVTVTVDIASGYNVGKIGDAVTQMIADFDVPTGYTLVIEGESEEINKAMNDLYLVLILAIIFVYLIMAAQFQSLRYPLIIMFTIPLSITGAVFALVIAGMELSIVAVVGFVLLVGIVINNGIVLIDYVNQVRAEGVSTREALIIGGRARLRPIIMTALITVVAMVVMALAVGSGSEMSQPMAVAIIGGLSYATILTLVVCPCLYELLSKKDISSADKPEPFDPSNPPASARY
ncbi:MAG: efflux RND transporter permease subunit [Coriobacteriales bacterium]|nr:efflux RND transporter permease subunit [Coriobacteriales bacterium]